LPIPPEHTKWKPGQSGNPNGRPKKLPDLDKLMAEVLGPNKNGRDGMEVIIEAMLKKAAKGDVKAAELLLNRGYGKAKQFISMNHEGGVNIVFEQATAQPQHEEYQDQVYGSIQEESGSIRSEDLPSNCEPGEHPIG
jgi:hypothetical protein